MKQIRMLKDVLTPRGHFRTGKSYEVGPVLGQAPVAWAKSWIGTGHAEETKGEKKKDAAPENKDKGGAPENKAIGGDKAKTDEKAKSGNKGVLSFLKGK